MSDAPGMDVPRIHARALGLRRPLAAAAGIVALVLATWALAHLRASAPAVDREAIRTDTVVRGPLVVEVQGPGTLVPEEVRWLSAPTAARVEEIRARPGTVVKAGDVLVVLGSPEVEMQSLEAQRQLAAAEASLASVAASRSGEVLAQQSALASLRSELAEARRRAAADEALARRGFLAQLDMARSAGAVDSLESRVRFEQERLATQSRGIRPERDALRAQVQRLGAIAAFRARQVEALQVKAGIDGVLQEVPLQLGQAVAAGALLARVARPDRLQAEVRIPETQAKDVLPGLLARVDTRNGIAAGKVTQVDPAAQGGTVRIRIAFEGELPQGARPDLGVDATIEIARVPGTLLVDRPVGASPGSQGTIFAVRGDEALRVPVQYGRASTRAIEVVAGLAEGDRVILSDMNRWDAEPRVRLR
jgi:HlyD family secretion protein